MSSESIKDEVQQVDVLADGFRANTAGNADRLAVVAADRLRYVKSWGKWITYRNGVWEVDIKSVDAIEIAQDVMFWMLKTSIDPNLDSAARGRLITWAGKTGSPRELSGMLQLAAGKPEFRIEHTDLDLHPELLNVRNGTIDLRTGNLLDHNPDHLLTKRLDVDYVADATSALWDKCLTEWQPDAEVRAYLQEKMGAGATGHLPEEFDIHVGTGGNGKSKFIGQIMHVLGAYAAIPDDTLIVVRPTSKHDTIFASLYGARLAVAGETTRGAKMNEAMIKRLTGGDELKARRMGENEWKFNPTMSLMLHTNYKPRISGTDEGLWRRIRLIPWEASFVGDPDLLLTEKLRDEASGTLNWIVQGAMRWLQRDREFIVPDVIQRVTDAYRAETDPIHTFLKEVLVEDFGSHIPISDAYEAFCAWRSDPELESAPDMKSKPEFSAYITERYGKGVTKKTPTPDKPNRTSKCWVGLRLDDARRAWLDELRTSQPARLTPGGPTTGQWEDVMRSMAESKS